MGQMERTDFLILSEIEIALVKYNVKFTREILVIIRYILKVRDSSKLKVLMILARNAS